MNISNKSTHTVAYILILTKITLFAFCHYSEAKTMYEITNMNFCIFLHHSIFFDVQQFSIQIQTCFKVGAVINLFVLS